MRVKAFFLLALVTVLAIGLYALLHATRSETPAPATLPAAAAPATVGAALGFAYRKSPTVLPDLAFVDGDGQPHHLSDFRGKVILLNFWATWCGPCRLEMPALERLETQLGGPDFMVLPLSIDSGGRAPVKAFYRKLQLKALAVHVDESGEAASALHTVGIPTTVLVDRDGRELARRLGAADWDSAAMIAFLQQQLKAQ